MPENITRIPAPRVDFIDPRTGLISREWYRFFLNLFTLTGSGQTSVTLEDLQIAPQVQDVLGELGIVYDQAQLASMMAQYEEAARSAQNQIDCLPSDPQLGTIASYNLNGGLVSGGIAYSDGIGVSISPAGTSGQLLTSGGTGAPTWTSLSSFGVSTFSAGTTGLTPSSPTAGAITLAGTLGATNGGTGLATYALGDILYSSAANTLAKLSGNITTTRQFLRQTGTGTVSAAPAWDTVTKTDVGLSNVENTALSTWAGSTNITTLGTVATGTWSATTIAADKGGTGQTTYAVGDLLYANTTSTLAKLADVATGNALISGGVGVAPSWGKIGLTTHVSGTLPVANGGTGLTAGTSGGVLYYSATGTLASSSLLAANALVVGGGAGVAPSTITTGTGVVTALGVNTGTAGAFVVNGGALGTPSSGTLTSCTGLPLTTGVTGTLAATNGGTGQASYAVGDILYASTTTALSRLAATTSGLALITNGVGIAPSYGKIGLTTHVNGTLLTTNGGTGFNTYAVGDLLYASATNALAKLADVATGNALISGGVGVAPSWGKIGLTTHVSGTLGVGNGGTGTATAFTPGSVVFAGTSGIYSQDNTNLFWDAANIFLGVGTNTPSHTIEAVSYSQLSSNVSYASIKIRDLWPFDQNPEPGIVFTAETSAGVTNPLGTFSVIKTATASGDATSTIKLCVSTATPGTLVTAMQLASDGYAQCNGLKFPSTAALSTDPNTLDDYEEGNWTPTIVGGTTAGTGTYTIQVGRYTRIGRDVTITGRVTWTAHTGTGTMRIGGLPFTSLNATNIFFAVTFGWVSNVVYTAANTPMGYVNTNSTQIILVQMPSGGGAMTNVNMDAAGDYIFSCTYMV